MWLDILSFLIFCFVAFLFSLNSHGYQFQPHSSSWKKWKSKHTLALFLFFILSVQMSWGIRVPISAIKKRRDIITHIRNKRKIWVVISAKVNILMIMTWCLCSFSVVMLFKLITSKCVYKANSTNLGLRFLACLAELSNFA